MSRPSVSDDDSARPEPEAPVLQTTGFPPWRDGGWRSPLDVLAFVATAVSLWLVAGIPGVLTAGALAIVWLAVPPVVVFAVGTVAVTALLPSGTPLFIAALPIASLAVLLLSTLTDHALFRHTLILLGAGVILTGVLVLVVALAGTTWLAGVALLIAAAAWYVSVDLMTLSHVGSADE